MGGGDGEGVASRLCLGMQVRFFSGRNLVRFCLGAVLRADVKVGFRFRGGEFFSRYEYRRCYWFFGAKAGCGCRHRDRHRRFSICIQHGEAGGLSFGRGFGVFAASEESSSWKFSDDDEDVDLSALISLQNVDLSRLVVDRS